MERMIDLFNERCHIGAIKIYNSLPTPDRRTSDVKSIKEYLQQEVINEIVEAVVNRELDKVKGL